MFKCGIVFGGLAAATILGTFAAGPALASTGSPHRIPVVVHEAARTSAAPSATGKSSALPLRRALGQPLSDPTPAPVHTVTVDGVPYVPAMSGGLVPAVGNAAGSLLSGLGLPAVGALVGGTPASQNLSGPLSGLLGNLTGSNGLNGLGNLLSGSNGLPDLGKLLSGLNGQNGLPDLGKLLSGQNGLPDLGKLLSGQNGLPDLGKLLSGQNGLNGLGDLLNGQNPLSSLLNGSNGLNALSALGNLLNGAKPPIGG